MIPHSAWEIVPLLLELVEQPLHAFDLGGQICGGHFPGVRVGVDQAQLLEGGAAGALLDDAGDRAPALRVFVVQLPDRPTAAVAADQHVATGGVGIRPYPQRLLEPDQLDVGCQLVEAVHAVKVFCVLVEQGEVQIGDLLPCVGFGHRQHTRKHVAQIKARLLSHGPHGGEHYRRRVLRDCGFPDAAPP